LGGGVIDLGGLSDGAWTAARAVNDVGQVILWGMPAGTSENRAAFWDGNPLNPVIDLGTLGGHQSWAYGLNNYGFVVGAAENENSFDHAFVWNGTEKTDLGTLGGYHSAAYGINDAGVIVGYADDAFGVRHAVRWEPVPEPTTFLLWLVGGAMLGLRRRWRR
jgi:probable HAF family extracellular repeat protein